MENHTTTTTTEQSAFTRALDEWLSNRRALDALPVTDTEVETRFMDALSAAERRLFKATPKTIADVRALAEIAWQDADSLPPRELVASILMNLRRLDNDAPSRTFNPEAWLSWFERSGGGWVEREGEIILLVPSTGNNVADAMWQLETLGGLEQVRELIRQRHVPQTAPVQTWGTLKSAYETASARLDEHCAIRSPEVGDDAIDNYETKTGVLADARADALTDLILFPAPNCKALAFKLRAYDAVIGGDSWTRGSELVAQLAADAAWLAGEA